MNLDNFNKFIFDIEQPPYPPYHKGKYLEQYFIDFYFKNKESFDNTGYQFLPVCWTDIYLHRGHLLNDLQKELLSLDQNKKYFTVSQHDDAPYQTLPPNTIKFSAGGNRENCLPIPLICSSIENVKQVEKDIFCSFVGSITQNIPNTWGEVSHSIRMNMLHVLVDKPDYVLKPKHWSPEIKSERQDLFLDITSRSKFTLCPRGYGATSFRLYEAMQLRSVPIYIYYNKPYIPFSDELDWNKLAVLIDANDLSNIDHVLKSITDEKYNEMLNYIEKTYPKYFTLNGMCDKILQTLKKSNGNSY